MLKRNNNGAKQPHHMVANRLEQEREREREREQKIIQWLENDLGYKRYTLKPASADASFRRYFRLYDKINTDSKIVMDAPPDKEDSHPFIKIAQSFYALGLNVPKVYAQNFESGFFLLSDLGSIDYLQALDKDNATRLYQDAIQALITLQCNNTLSLPLYDTALLQQEMNLFVDWYLVKHRQIQLTTAEQQMLNDSFALLTASALSQPQVCVHRDYHSRNLMLTADNNPGVLDFQDAVIGPISYDLVSLLRDCYVAWPEEQVSAWCRYYYQLTIKKALLKEVSYSQFERWFDLMGLQRHLKATGIFARLNYRDGKSGYLKDIPRTLAYVAAVSGKYPELKAFNQFVVKLSS